MGNLKRSLKRKKKKEFVKNFKNTMRNFRESIMCKICDRIPDAIAGEKIDDWMMENRNGLISLTCPTCVEEQNDNR